MMEETTASGFLYELSKMDGEAVFFFFLMALVTLLVLVGVISRLIYTIHKNRLEADLKESLIEQGFSADEIVKVIHATAQQGKRTTEHS